MNHDSRHGLLPDDDAPSPGLAAALARLRDDLDATPVPPSIWRRVAAHARPVPVEQAVPASGPAAPRRGPAWSTWATLAAAGLALVLVWFAGPGRHRATAPSPSQPNLTDAGASAIGAGPVGRVPRASEAAPAWVVRTERPRERLAELGLPYDPARAGDLVHAELLMHPSGDVLAVRLTR